MKKSYCKQNNGDCATCSLVNYGLDCANNPINFTISRTGTKNDRALAVYDGHKGPQTVSHIKEFIGPELAKVLTGKEYGLVMSAVNRAYHAGKASTGAEMIDSSTVFINSLGRAIEWTEEGAEYEKITEPVPVTGPYPAGATQTISKKVKDGKLVARFTDNYTISPSGEK
jgi:hypothetical protein